MPHRFTFSGCSAFCAAILWATTSACAGSRWREISGDLEVVTIPANTYAVFTSRGKMPEAFIETYHRIVTEFFPRSAQYEYAENVEFEVYSSADISDPNYRCEIWIAVKEKAE